MALLILTLLLLLAGCQSPQPRLQVGSLAIDLGDIPNGVVETRRIPVRNTGEGELIVTSVSTSCGCTEAAVLPATIPPGGEGVLEIAFDSGAHGPELTGPLLRQIFINSNDSENPEVVVEVSVNVVPGTGEVP